MKEEKKEREEKEKAKQRQKLGGNEILIVTILIDNPQIPWLSCSAEDTGAY